MSFNNAVTGRDTFILSCFVIFITWHPYFLYAKINIFELGLYLPGIDAILRGMVPFRDFFHLRGALELYVPALMMKISGVNAGVLELYFYVGTVISLIICVLIAKEIIKTRLILYLFVLVVTARTFPRVVFTYWGGMRYALGLLALFCAVKFFKREKPVWIFLSGLFSILGLLTSIEIGACAVTGVLASFVFCLIFRLQEKRIILKNLWVYLLGIAAVLLPYGIYLIWTHSLAPYLDSVYTVVTRMQKTFDPGILAQHPESLKDVLYAMFMPQSKNFRHMSPAHFYIIFFGYLAFRARYRKLSQLDLCAACVGIYGVVMYTSAFRLIWASQFEMALQPQKILLFFILERAWQFLGDWQKGQVVLPKLKWGWVRKYAVNIFLVILIVSSVGYSLDRYNKRFFVFKYVSRVISNKNFDKILPFPKSHGRQLTIERMKGMTVPLEQADEFETLVAFFNRNTTANEAVLVFPELGAYNFIIQRPFVGRFPMVTFSWFHPNWHKEFMGHVNETKPRFIIMPRVLEQSWKDNHLGLEENREKYQEMLSLIESRYVLEKTTPLSYIYKRKN